MSYHDVLIWMYKRYMSPDSYYSHGFIIPLVSGFLIWQKRKELKEEETGFSRSGLFLIISAVLIHVVGTIIYVFSLSGFSVFLLIMGISLFLLGKNITRIIWFPLVFTIFMFPLPEAFISVLSFPMKLLVAEIGVRIIDLMGIPIYREGFNITIQAGSLLVGNPCSGLRSLISFLALGAVFAYMSNTSTSMKWLLFFVTIPIALLSNMIRVPILILISHFWGLSEAAPDSFWHDASGVFVFVLGLFLLFCTGRILQCKSCETDICC